MSKVKIIKEAMESLKILHNEYTKIATGKYPKEWEREEKMLKVMGENPSIRWYE